MIERTYSSFSPPLSFDEGCYELCLVLWFDPLHGAAPHLAFVVHLVECLYVCGVVS
jgi:hypothetical protein